MLAVKTRGIMDMRILGILASSKEKFKADLVYWEKELKNNLKLDEINLFPMVTNREGYDLIINDTKKDIKIIDEFFKEQKGE